MLNVASEIRFLTRLVSALTLTRSEAMPTSPCSTEIMSGILTMRSKPKKKIWVLRCVTGRLSVVVTMSRALTSPNSKPLSRTSRRTREKRMSRVLMRPSDSRKSAFSTLRLYRPRKLNKLKRRRRRFRTLRVSG